MAVLVGRALKRDTSRAPDRVSNVKKLKRDLMADLFALALVLLLCMALAAWVAWPL